MTTKSLTRRFAFRPWLIEFLDMCFKNFRVAFSGIKSLSNMEDVVALNSLACQNEFDPP